VETLDDSAVESFIDCFFGYGNWGAPVWFIGMEEGGGGTIAEAGRRIETWRIRGKLDLEDLVEFHYAIGITKHLGPRPALQPTWSKLVHLLLGMNEETATDERVRAFQSKELGRRGGSSALVELLPLPSPGIAHWIYGDSTTIPYLSSRERYRRHVVRQRIAAIRERAASYGPAVVVFLGLSYAAYWSEIAGLPLVPARGDDFVTAKKGQTMFAVVKHPAARGVTNTLYSRIGEILALTTSSSA
jgi:hypothetical protein